MGVQGGSEQVPSDIPAATGVWMEDQDDHGAATFLTSEESKQHKHKLLGPDTGREPLDRPKELILGPSSTANTGNS